MTGNMSLLGADENAPNGRNRGASISSRKPEYFKNTKGTKFAVKPAHNHRLRTASLMEAPSRLPTKKFAIAVNVTTSAPAKPKVRQKKKLKIISRHIRTWSLPTAWTRPRHMPRKRMNSTEVKVSPIGYNRQLRRIARYGCFPNLESTRRWRSPTFFNLITSTVLNPTPKCLSTAETTFIWLSESQPGTSAANVVSAISQASSFNTFRITFLSSSETIVHPSKLHG